MLTADFVIVKFNEHLGDKPGDLKAPSFNFVGNQSSLKNFTIPGVPAGDGYLFIQAADVQKKGHKILINGTDLPGTDIDKTGGGKWRDVMDVIPSGVLHKGNNTIKIQGASGGDNFLIANVVVHWRHTLIVEEAQHALKADEAEHAKTAAKAEHARTADKLAPKTGNDSVVVGRVVNE